MHTCVGVTLVTHWSHSTLLRVCVCAVRVTRVHVCQCTCRVHGCSAVCACVVFSFFADGDSVCDTMSRRNTARTPSLRDSDTQLPVRFTIPPGAAQSDPELRELSPMRSGLAVRGGNSYWPVNERNLPCCFVAVPLFLAP